MSDSETARQELPDSVAAKPRLKIVLLDKCKLPQILRRLSAIGFNRIPDERYVNSSSEANIQEIAYGTDTIDVEVTWLVIQACKPFAYPAAASETFARRRREKLQRELHIAKEYWVQTIQPNIAGRKLPPTEWYLADHAYKILQRAKEKAVRWNNTVEGQPTVARFEALEEGDEDRFRPPEVLCADESLKPEMLAAIGASLMNYGVAERTPGEAIRVAYELLVAAQRFVSSLPKQPDMVGNLHLGFSKVTRVEILWSNRVKSKRLPLLPPNQAQRNAKEADMPPLSEDAIKGAVKSFLTKRLLHLTRQEYDRDRKQEKLLAKGHRPLKFGGTPMTYEDWQEEQSKDLDNWLQHGLISLRDLCILRWERFVNFQTNQAARGLRLRGKPKPKKPKLPKKGVAPVGKRRRGTTNPLD